MFRRPGGGGRSKAAADTLCQKCLKRDIYECTVSAQDRPYKSRPSRTQQLLNPNLRPKLSAEVPNELLRKKGTADDILKKKEEERGRRSSFDRKRSRSASISSIDSISTVSTNRSRSRAQAPLQRQRDKAPRRGQDVDTHRKRVRRSMSVDSPSSEDTRMNDRNTRRRMSSFSPGPRGRRRSRSRSSRMETSLDREPRHKFRHNRKPRSRSPDRSYRVRSRSRSRHRHGRRPVRQWSASQSPDRMETDLGPRTGASRASPPASPPIRRLPSRSPSPYRNSRQHSLSPFSKRKAVGRPVHTFDAHLRNNGDGALSPPRNRFNEKPPRQDESFAQPQPINLPPPVSRERSLSPYSKRVAMTRMQHAR